MAFIMAVQSPLVVIQCKYVRFTDTAFLHVYCRLKAYIVFTFLDSFRNKSGKPRPIWTKVGTHAQVKGWQCSQNVWRNRLSGGKMGGWKVSPTPEFFVSNTRWLFGNFPTADFSQIWPRHENHGWNADFGQKFIKSFHSGVTCLQNHQLWGGQTGTSLRAGYRSRDALQRDTVYSAL